MKDYNDLTKRLLAAGYTIENYPENVRIPSGQYGPDPLDNIYGGFEYRLWYRDNLVYQTGCKKFVKGSKPFDMSFNTVNWSHENNNPVIRCPYDNSKCEVNNPLLHGIQGGGLCIQCWCECHQTEEPYDYENSIEKAEFERKEESKRKYREYSELHNGRVCEDHMYYNELTKTWQLIYSPHKCAQYCNEAFCPIRNRELDKKKGNVFYDLKTSTTRHDGTLFDGDKNINITKGIRWFEHPVSMDICSDFIKLQSKEIYDKYYMKHGSTMKMFDSTFEFEIVNVRAENRPSRDLLQDIQDIKDGIRITHESDRLKNVKEDKKQRKEETQVNKVKKLEKKILSVGYYNLPLHSLNRVHADKLLGKNKIMELERERKKKLTQEAVPMVPKTQVTETQISIDEWLSTMEG